MSRIEESLYSDWGYVLSYKMGYDINADENHDWVHMPVAYFTDIEHIDEWMKECGYEDLPDYYIIDGNIPTNEGPKGITMSRRPLSNEDYVTFTKDEMGNNQDFDDNFKEDNV